MTSDLVASSPITHQPINHRYDVFVSFRGRDVRNNFLSHLEGALSNNKIKFFIDKNLRKGDPFPPALLAAIEESSMSIIIFSENYADSTWCLEELAKIMECKNSIHKQIVLPVFYKVDPTDVRNQTGNFGSAFDRHQERSKGKINFDKARSHLKEVANISGWDSSVTRPEEQLITGIVGDVLHNMNKETFSYSNKLVGVFPHVEKVESLLCLDASDVSVVGIWGMGGIGKSTIAKAVFNHMCQKFEASHFVSNLQDELKRHTLDTVRERLLRKIFEKECQTMGTQSLGPDFIRRQLPRKKVFIGLDDVDDPIQLKDMLEGHNYSFGSGSKILITSRDIQVLKNVTDKIHTMEIMNENDAMTLFSLNAFKQEYPTKSYEELSERAIYYANGNPLALVVLGSALFDRSEEFWVSTLESLEKEPNSDIKNVLRSSYDTLSPGERKIFLDIACFLFGFHQDFINQYYGNLGISKIETLEDRCLVTVSSSNTVEMHDLLKEIGQSIDRENYDDKPEKHERLWHPEDVCSFLTKKTGAAKIKALLMDMDKIKVINSNAFVGMDSLRFLKVINYKDEAFLMDDVCSLRFLKFFSNDCRVKYLPPELRYFEWDGFPAKHLPSKFVAENLIELWLDGSNIEELWRGDKSQGILTNLQVISLKGCSNLIKLPDMSKAKNLKRIDLSGCKRCGNVSSVIISEVLEYLDLSNCLNMTRFPDISSKKFKYLNLSWSNIEEVPSSIEHTSRHEQVSMWCQSLSTISTKTCKFKSLKYVRFHGVKLERLPEILEPMENLMFNFGLHGCKNLKSFPRNWYDMESSEEIHLSYCKNLNSLASNLYLDESGVEELRPLITFQSLLLDNCRSLNISSVAYVIPSFSFLKELDIRLNDWGMPSSLQRLKAHICESLEGTNCFKLQEATRNQILAHSHFMMTQLAEDYIFYVFLKTEITEWIGRGVGSCVTIKFPSSHDNEYWSQFRGFGFCVEFSELIGYIVSFNFQCILKQNDHVICRLGIESRFRGPVTEHLFMWRCIDDKVSELDLDELMGKEVSFECSISGDGPFEPFDVRKCGVEVLFENTAPLPTSLISSATNTEDDQLLISASSSIPPSLQKTQE